MKAGTPLNFVLAIGALATGAATVLVAEGSLRPERIRHAEEWQRLVGGLGLGPATHLTRCPFRFDPRLCPACPQDYGPIPGGSWCCPCQGCSIFHYPPLRGHECGETDGNGLLP
jgi:hypothetical protein